jgi:Reverse transcriptase (RNA-dependent DNA polymerase).
MFIIQLLGFEISFVAWSGLLILEFKSLMRGEVCKLGHFVLRWHNWAGIWRKLLLVFRFLPFPMIIFKLTILEFASFPVKIITVYLHSRTFVAAFQKATDFCSLIRAGAAQGGVISHVLFSLYVNEIPTPSRRIELVQYADDTALVATSNQPALLVKYMEAHFSELEKWLRDWKIVINVGKSAALLFTTRHIPPPRPLRCLEEEIRWEETIKYLGWPSLGDLTGLVT